MAMGQSAGLLFTIKADSSQAQSEIKKVKGDVKGMSDQSKLAMSDIIGPATAAAASIAAIGVAVAAAGKFLFTLAQNAATLGAAIYDVQQKTGLAAATLSTLKITADSTGTSFESIGDSVQKFSILLGEAQKGNEKANATLADNKIKARDLNTALNEAIKVIAKETDVTKQAAAAKALFGDESGDLIPVIKKLNGDLAAATRTAEQMGTTLGEDDVRAANDLRNAINQLSEQVRVGAAKFALAYGPQITAAIKDISKTLADNKDEWAKWGAVVGDMLSNVKTMIAGAAQFARDNPIIVRVITNFVTAGAAEAGRGAGAFLQNYDKIGTLFNGTPTDRPDVANDPRNPFYQGRVKGSASGTLAIGSDEGRSGVSGGGGSGGGGGGGSAKDDAERRRQAAVRAAEKEMQQRLAIFAAGYKEEVALQEQALSLKGINEAEYEGNLGKIRKNALENQKQLLKNFLELTILNKEEREKAEHEIAIIDKELATERIETATKVYEVIKSLTEKETRDFEDAQEKRRRAERKRANDRARLEVDPSGVKQERKKAENDANLSILGDSVLSIRNDYGDLTDMISPSLPMLQLGGQALANFASGIGNVVQNLILMGSAGPNAMKKLVASVLAGVSAQAATLAIMETAYGIAALTAWGRVLYGDPVKHFKAAALFAAVAVGTGIAGRAVAGNSFQQAAGGATGGSGSGDPSKPDAYTTTAGNPFTDKIDKALDKVAMVNAQLEETLHGFRERIEGISPGEVVRMGAGDAQSEIFDAVADNMGDRGAPAAGKLVRNMGLV